DLVAQEHEILAEWRARRTFERLRAQNTGGPKWSFLDGPITANSPMGVHHAWGRAYKDVFQRFHAMLGEDQRWQNGFDCQGLWVEVNVERDLGFTNKRDIEDYGIAEFVSLCKQRVLTYAARQTEQSVRLGMWMDWNDPDELRRLRDLLAADPSRPTTIEGPDGPVTDSVEMLVGRLGMPDVGGRYVTVRQGDAIHWLAKGTLKQALTGTFEVLEERPGSELVGWRYAGPFDDLPAVRKAFATGASPIAADAPYEHRVVAWDEVGEEEGTGIVHVAPGCGAEDFALVKAIGLPMFA